MVIAVQKYLDHPCLERVLQALLPHRLLVNICVHALLFTFSYAYSIVLLNGMVIDAIAFSTFVNTVLPLLFARLLIFQWHDLFQGLWRYVSFEDLINIVRAVVISSLLFYFTGLVWDRFRVSEALYILDLTFCLLCTGGIRSLVRNVRERFTRLRANQAMKRVLLVGPLNKIQPILKEFVGDPRGHYLPVAVVDPSKNGKADLTRLCDVPVLSTEQVLAGQRHMAALDAVIFCWPGSSRKEMDALVECFQPLAVPFKTIPHLEDILDSRVSISDIREVEIEDLLDRPPVSIEMEKISAYLKDKTILVTGGGGSIGSEICRQAARFHPKRMVVVERSENSLYDLIGEFSRNFPDIQLIAQVSTVNDAEGIAAIMQAQAVDVVFHAAAYKHVPLMEDTPVESAYNNIEGTYNTAMAALKAGVRRFVMISTDKAVNPSNVMGVTKRIAEMLVQSMSNEKTRFMTVRFGNVLGSAGSVIPIFKRQIALGGPVTVTHPEIERFFMTIPEAVQLVLQAGCMGHGGEIFVLDMGQPVKILKLAEKLITLSGKVPYDEVDIVFSGLRPGEKMYEELFNDHETLCVTGHDRIRAAACQVADRALIEAQFSQIRDLIRSKDEAALLGKFRELVPGYHCPGPSAAGLLSCRPAAEREPAASRRADIKAAVTAKPIAELY
jgi:FlaA1/EpsC-like NDP-sugar epimerase